MTILTRSRGPLLCLVHLLVKIWPSLVMIWPENTLGSCQNVTNSPGPLSILRLIQLHLIWLERCLSSIQRKDILLSNVSSIHILRDCIMRRQSLRLRNHLIGLGMILSLLRISCRKWYSRSHSNFMQKMKIDIFYIIENYFPFIIPI